MLAFLVNFLGMFLVLEGFWQTVHDAAVVVVTFGTFGFFAFWGIVVLVCLGFGGIGEKYWVTGFLFFVLFGAFLFLGVIAPLVWIYENPWWAVLLVVGYFVIGFLWVAFRWGKYINQVRHTRGKRIREYLQKTFPNTIRDHHDSGESTDSRASKKERKQLTVQEAVELLKEDEKAWYEELTSDGVVKRGPVYLNDDLEHHVFRRNSYSDELDIGTPSGPPLLGNHKKEFATYFFYWPLDVLIYFFAEFLKDLWNFIVDRIQNSFNYYAAKFIKQKIDID